MLLTDISSVVFGPIVNDNDLGMGLQFSQCGQNLSETLGLVLSRDDD